MIPGLVEALTLRWGRRAPLPVPASRRGRRERVTQASGAGTSGHWPRASSEALPQMLASLTSCSCLDVGSAAAAAAHVEDGELDEAVAGLNEVEVARGSGAEVED